ncbi:MAG: sulfate/thiosulfate transport system ATP-binding protein [Solirubrobacteraceae bacterium]|nr:sulfate/thiosulfate transport system ATP-binding protein [Solirubrobacteraceae bacterium]
MEISDNIAVLHDGRLEQVGGPRDLYEHPRTPFVMGFLGPVTQLGDSLVRPHDIRISLHDEDDSVQAQVVRVVHLGFEVRVELTLGDGEELTVQTTRGEAEELELSEGDIVQVRCIGPRTPVTA